MKKNLWLINPWIYDFAAYDFWIKPLGFLYLASILRKNQYNLTYIDCLDTYHPMMQEYLAKNNIHIKRKPDGSGKFYKTFLEKPSPLKGVARRYGRYGITLEIFNQILSQSPRPDAVLITSMMTYWYPGVAKVIELVRNYDHSLPIILGGNLVTLCPQTAISLGADFCVSGEGENKVLILLKEITGGHVYYAPDLDNLDDLPYPAFDLQKKVGFIPLQTSRGCPFRCIYCAAHLLQPKLRQRQPESVRREIEYSFNLYGVRHFVFYDDALCYKPQDHLLPLLRAIEAKGLALRFHTPNALHAAGINQELADLLYRTGFCTIRLGFETSDPVTQRLTGGKVNNEQFQQAVQSLNIAGFTPAQIGVYILGGIPRQKIGEIEESVDFVLAHGALPILTEFSPIPGTQLWSGCIKSSPYNLSSDPLLHNNSILPCQWEGFSWEDYLALKIGISKKIKEKFYSN